MPIARRIEYKLALITHKVLNTGQLEYLNSIVKEYKPQRQLRSQSHRLLSKPSAELFKLFGPGTLNFRYAECADPILNK